MAPVTDSARPPADTEVEVSVFGPGVGECVLCHLGGGEWVVIDSCIDRATKLPVALVYLASIGIDPAQAIKAIVVTHWHDDHIRGMAKVVEAVPGATIHCSAALNKDEFFTAIAASRQHHMPGQGSGTDEFAAIFGVLQARDGTGVPSVVLSPHWTKEGSLIYRKGQSEVLALSPSDGAMLASFHEIARGMEPLLPAVSATKKRAISIEPNKAAIVLSVRVEARTFLLGADLEVSSVPQIGWHAVRTCNLRHPEPAGFFKVPHHGSENADDQLVWDEMLQEGPVAALTPFTRSSLPRAADLARLATRTNRIYCTARSTGYSPRPRPVDKWGVLMRNRRALSGPMGHVRYRVSDTDPVGTVALFGAAYQFAP